MLGRSERAQDLAACRGSSAVGAVVCEDGPTNSIGATCAFECLRARIDEKRNDFAVGMVEHVSKRGHRPAKRPQPFRPKGFAHNADLTDLQFDSQRFEGSGPLRRCASGKRGLSDNQRCMALAAWPQARAPARKLTDSCSRVPLEVIASSASHSSLLFRKFSNSRATVPRRIASKRTMLVAPPLTGRRSSQAGYRSPGQGGSQGRLQGIDPRVAKLYCHASLYFRLGRAARWPLTLPRGLWLSRLSVPCRRPTSPCHRSASLQQGTLSWLSLPWRTLFRSLFSTRAAWAEPLRLFWLSPLMETWSLIVLL